MICLNCLTRAFEPATWTNPLNSTLSSWVSDLSRQEIRQNNAEIAFLQDPEASGAKLELALYRNQRKFVQADYEDRIFDRIALEIDNMDLMISKLRDASVTITDEPFRLRAGGSLIAFIEDPDGTLIELIESPRDAQ